MKKAIKVTMLSLLSVVTLGGAVAGALSWFLAETNLPEVDIKANSAGAYFAYGTGTEDDPYGIATTRHLNNLAWLQYNGSFNADYDEDEEVDHFYFELANDINANGFCIPPIGTEEYPFIGVFNGNGHTITGVSVSNSASDYSDKPIRITYTTDPEIVGFFGVVGELSGESYSSAINTVKDLTLEDITVESTTEQTLIGIAAGYVNADMSGVVVKGDATIDVGNQGATALSYTDKISDYGLVGYSTKRGSSGDYYQDVSTYYDSTLDDSGSGDDWGGSIDMVSLFERIQHFRPNTTNSQDLDITHRYLDGEFDEDQVTTTQNLYSYRGNTGNNYSGNVFMNTKSTSSGGGTRYYLVGGHFERNAYYETYDITSGWYITDGGGNYLNRNNSSYTNGTNRNTATIWEFESTDGTGYIRTINEGTYYYLRNNAGTLQVTTNEAQATDWTIAQDDTNLDIQSVYNNTTYRLLFYNNNWVLHDKDDYIHVDGYTSISRTTGGNTYYINATSNGTTFNATTDQSQEMHWFVDENGYYYCIKNNVTYYLCMNVRYGNGNNRYRRPALTTDYTQNYYYPVIKSGNYIRTEERINYNGTNYYYYLRYNNGWTYYQNTGTTPGNNYQVTVTTYEDEDNYFSDMHLYNELADDPIDDSKERQTGEEDLGIIFDPNDTTYLPLNVYQSGDNQYQPTAKNTGYITAGMTQRGNNTDYRSMVVADYDIRMIQNSYSRTTKVFDDTKVLTIDGSGIRTINTSNLVKYSDSKTALEGKLEGRTRVGGLHFVSQSGSDYGYISTDYIVNATNVSIQGVDYPQYELPVYSIDFNLKRKGYINFFAGAYNGGYSYTSTTATSTNCNCFFTLHKVERNEAKTHITRIREIKAIYKSSEDATTYTYTYKNGNSIVDENGSTSFDYSSYQLLFDTDWLGINSGIASRGGSVFYFEIPIDSGEYCLGNVGSRSSAGEGCYLMYLDIGASGDDVRDVVNAYNITSKTTESLYPIGVDFGVVGVEGEGGESICVYIADSETGTITFTINAGGDEISISDSGGIATYSYQSETFGDSYIVSGNSPGELEPPVESFVRKSYIRIWQSNGVIYDAMIIDSLDENGEVLSSSYTLDGDPIEYDVLIGTVDALNSTRIGKIRDLENVIHLEREQGTSVFEATLPEMEWEDQTAYDFTISMTADLKIRVTITDSYAVTINGTAVSNNGLYPNS